MRKHKIWQFDHEKIQMILDSSQSYSDVCLSLGLTLTKSNLKMISYRIKKEFFNLEKFNENKSKKIMSFKLSRPLEEILVENSTYIHTNNLKNKLIKFGIIKNECVKCGNTGEWLGEKITLQLDHINGINNDNRLENLRILCPNCHSQTETYAGKKKKEIKITKKLIICGNCDNPSNGKLFCDDCQNKFAYKRRVVNRPSLNELKMNVNKFGYSATGRKYGVSDNTIRKWLKIE